jgi:hypothetical protein
MSAPILPTSVASECTFDEAVLSFEDLETSLVKATSDESLQEPLPIASNDESKESDIKCDCRFIDVVLVYWQPTCQGMCVRMDYFVQGDQVITGTFLHRSKRLDCACQVDQVARDQVDGQDSIDARSLRLVLCHTLQLEHPSQQGRCCRCHSVAQGLPARSSTWAKQSRWFARVFWVASAIGLVRLVTLVTLRNERTMFQLLELDLDSVNDALLPKSLLVVCLLFAMGFVSVMSLSLLLSCSLSSPMGTRVWNRP